MNLKPLLLSCTILILLSLLTTTNGLWAQSKTTLSNDTFKTVSRPLSQHPKNSLASELNKLKTIQEDSTLIFEFYRLLETVALQTKKIKLLETGLSQDSARINLLIETNISSQSTYQESLKKYEAQNSKLLGDNVSLSNRLTTNTLADDKSLRRYRFLTFTFALILLAENFLLFK